MVTIMQDLKKHCAETYNVAIIGLGPKGLYGLERLLAQLETMNLQRLVKIHVFNQNAFFGAGDVYRCDQPSYLIMNYANKNINIRSNELPVGILEETASFTQWLSKKTGRPASELDGEFAPRALVGNYLMDGFTRLCQCLPKNVQVVPHINSVTDIKKRSDGYTLKTIKKDVNLPKRFKKILLTTGHSWNGANFNKAQKASSHIDFIYPTDEKLARIYRSSHVGIKGLGLTYIDAVLSLTEGRGGIFKKSSKDAYTYFASGEEPEKIFPFSRTGIPMIPRNGAADDSLQPYFLTEETLKNQEFLSPVHFKDTVLPLIKKEFLFNYYRVIFRNQEEVLRYHPDFELIKKQIERFHEAYPSVVQFDWATIEDPFAVGDAPTHAEFLRYSYEMLNEAEKGVHLSPLVAAAGAWRKISAVFNKIYCFGGMDAASHQLFDSYYFGFFNRIAYGPPLENVRKLHALAECGLLDYNYVQNPEVIFEERTNSFRMQSSDKKKAISLDFLVDARIPKGTVHGKVGVLFTNLLKRGILRHFVNEDDVKYVPGCLDLDYKGRPLNREGIVNPDLTFYGTPTEGITFDNDTLSRKRNNFASQWAFDITVDINSLQERHKKVYEREIDLQPR